MRPINPPLKQGDRGAEVINLQDGLRLLFAQLPEVLRPIAQDLQFFMEPIAREQLAQNYGPATSKFIINVQARLHLPQTGNMDAVTAELLNGMLKELGAFTDAPPPPSVSDFEITGSVSSPDRAGVGGLRVVIVDKNPGPDAAIPGAEALTDPTGRYKIQFRASALPIQGKQQPDLQARVFASEVFLGASDVRYNAGTNETLNVLLPANAAGLASEHETLTGAVAGHFAGKLVDLKEDDERQDVTYLANKTGWDARAVALASLADQFSQQIPATESGSGIPAAFHYALFRAGLSANADSLYHTNAATVKDVWKQAISQGVVAADLAPQIDGALKTFQSVAAQKLLTVPAVAGGSSIKQMLKVSGIDEDDVRQQQFADLYAVHRTNLPKFWDTVTAEFGPDTSNRLQVDGKLGFLTINNAPLMQAAHRVVGGAGITDPLQLAQAGFHRPEAWSALLNDSVPVPTEIPGDKPEVRQKNYAEYLAAKVRLSYPTATMAQMIKSGELQLKGAAPEVSNRVHEFLTKHQDKFEIGIQPIEQFIARNKLEVPTETVAQIKRIHRLHQITPSDQALNGLMKAGIEGAYHVAKYDRETFVQSHQEALGGPESAAQTYERAVQVHNSVFNIALGYLTARTAPGIGVHSAARIINPTPVSPDAADVIAYPTLERLFGSMDFCACDHCRSILSPAAYLVDLLQFLDPDEWAQVLDTWHKNTGGAPYPFADQDAANKFQQDFLAQHPGQPLPATEITPLQVLLERRPDIQHIPLTCENTNTALPYIDVVNEVLEYFIVNKLSLGENVAQQQKEFQGHDTGVAQSEDLMASPQFVMDSAYATLEGEHFPAVLPFHQPLESLRRYFDKFQVPLSLAMEKLRRNDDLERPAPSDPTNTVEYGWRDILMEEVGLSRAEYDLLTTSSASPNLLSQIYGFPLGTTDSEAIVTLSNAKRFSRRMEITYDDLVALLETRFVNPNSDLIPKLERLGVPFAELKKLKDLDTPAADAAFDELLPKGAGAPDAAEFGDNIKAWVKRQENYDRIMSIIVLTIPTWMASTTYLLGDCVTPTAPPASSFFYFECTKAGTSAAMEPDPWPAKSGSTIDNGTVEWTCRDDLSSSNFGSLAFRHADPARLSQSLDVDEFIRLLRFIRLWKKLGWTIEQTDAAICALLPLPAFPLGADTLGTVAKLDAAFLTLLPNLGIITRVLGLLGGSVKRDLPSALTLWSDIGTHGASSLYRRMFLNPAVLAQDPVFADDGYGNFLQRTGATYNHPTNSLEQPILDAASGQISYDPIHKRLSLSGPLSSTMRESLKAVAGVTSDFRAAVDDLYASQFLITHAGALRAALNLTDHEFSDIASALGFTIEVSASYTHTQATLEQAILDLAPNLSYDNASKRLSYAGALSSATRDLLKPIPGLSDAFRTAVDALFSANSGALTPLTLRNISAIYPRAWLARALKISVQELLLLSRLSGLDPFSPPEPTAPAILKIIALVQAMKERSLRSAAALYLIWNQNLSGTSAPDPAQLTEFARTLRADFTAIEDQFAATEDPGGELIRNRMALVYGQEVGDTFVSLLDDTLPLDVAYTHSQKTLEEVITKTDPKVSYDNFRHLLSYTGVLTTAKRDALKNIDARNAFKDAVDALFARGADIKGSFFARHQELEPLYNDFIMLQVFSFSVSYTHPAASFEAAITDVDSKLAYDSVAHLLSFTGILSVDHRDKLKAIQTVIPEFQAAVDQLFTLGEEADRKRHTTLLTVFRPELSRRRKRQQALQRLSAAANLDQASTVALMDPPAAPLPLHAAGQNQQPVLDDVIALETQGLAVQFFFRDTATGAVGQTILAAPNLDYSDGSNPLPRNPTPGALISGIWSGQVETPEAGFYNIVIEADAGAAVSLKIDGQDCPLTQIANVYRNTNPLELTGGTLYEFVLQVEKVRNSLKVKWETPRRAREVILARYLYPPSIFAPFADAYTRFMKVTSLAIGLGLTINEITHFGTDSQYQIAGDGWLNALPVSGDPTPTVAAALLQPFQALMDFAHIKAELSPAEESLLTVLRDPVTATANSRSLFYVLTHWDQKSLSDLLAHFGSNIPGLTRFDLLHRVYDVFALIQTMGISASAFVRATTNEPVGGTVRDFQAALRARYDAASWRDVVQPINDELRDLQRDALVGYILHRMRSNPATEQIDTADKLFEYFLTDVQMEPCMQTSRIRHALSSVQLFIERCLMNLEPRVSPATINATQWSWMKRYRVWEANRKIFLYPENWLEPELRDDKSPFFKEIESELLQSDITADTAAAAFTNYLSKLADVAKLQPCSIFREDTGLRTPDVDHVIARGGDKKFYYRRFDGSWSPWEHIKLDIEDTPVIPVVWKGEHGSRLLLFWLTILKKAKTDPSSSSSSDVQGPSRPKSLAECTVSEIKDSSKRDAGTNAQVTVQAVLCWSEYYNGKWQPTKTSDINQPVTVDPYSRSELKLASLVESDGLRIVIMGGDTVSFFLYNTHSLPVPVRNGGAIGNALNTKGSYPFISDNILKAYYVRLEGSVNLRRAILKETIPGRIVQSWNGLQDLWKVPFFLEDNRHVFYVTATSETIPIPAQRSYGLAHGSDQTTTATLPPLVFRTETTFHVGPTFLGDGAPVETRQEIIDPVPIKRFVTEDAYIRQGLGTIGEVKFGNKQIGPGGAITKI